MIGDRRRAVLAVIVALGAAAACATLEWQPMGPRRTALVPDAEPVGAEECGVCHEDVQGHEKIAAYHGDCESCHGGGSLHADSEATGEIRFPANEDCLACHLPGYDTQLQWGTGEHSRAGLLCSDCHNPHRRSASNLRPPGPTALRDLDRVSGLCIGCHRDVEAAQTLPSHHPVGAGGMSCVSCHDPHEDRRTSMGAADQRCSTCHQDVVGPWIFEHPPVVENCGFCHDPHGAPTSNLLSTIQPALCLSCHSLNDLWHHGTAGTGIAGNTTITQNRPTAPGEVITPAESRPFLRRCTDCHGAIHGSYTDEHLRH